MASTVIQSSERRLSFEQVRGAHQALMTSCAAYEEDLALPDADGHFTIDFRDRIPPAPDSSTIELSVFTVSTDFGSSWHTAAVSYQQLLRFAADPEHRGASCGMSLHPNLTDPTTGESVRLSIDLPETDSSGSLVSIVFYESIPGQRDVLTCRRCVESMLEDVFPGMSVSDTAEGFSITTPSQKISFGPVYQTFRAQVLLPWPQNELVERLPSLLPADWKPKPWIGWLISYATPGLEAPELSNQWRCISEHFRPVPKGFIDGDCVLINIDGLETLKGGAKSKRGVPITLGTFKWKPRQRGKLVARAFPDGYSLEFHTKSADVTIIAEIESATGLRFK